VTKRVVDDLESIKVPGNKTANSFVSFSGRIFRGALLCDHLIERSAEYTAVWQAGQWIFGRHPGPRVLLPRNAA